VLPGAESSAREWQGRKASQIAFGATALFAAQLYLSPAQWFPQIEPLHVALLLSFIGLAALCVQRVLSNQPLWMGWRTAFLAVYAGEAILSPMWSIDRAHTIPGALEVGKHFLFFVALVNTATTAKRLRIAFTMYAIAAIVPGWGTFNNWLHDELLVEGFRGRWLGVMADPNHDAMALVGAIPLLLFLAVGKDHSRWKRAVGIAGAAACIMGVVATHSRGGSIGLAAAVLVFALLSRRRAIAGTLALVATAGVLLFAPHSFWARNETITDYEADYSVQGRMQAWQVSFRIVRDHPLIGVGEAAFLEAWSQYAPIDAGHRRYVAHNLFLEVVGQLGVIGLFGYVGFILCALWSAWRARNGELGGEARAVLAALIGYLVCQQFSGYSLSWFLFTLCAFATCCDAWSPRKKVAEPEGGGPLDEALLP
jgi:O-antigen ligase